MQESLAEASGGLGMFLFLATFLPPPPLPGSHLVAPELHVVCSFWV